MNTINRKGFIMPQIALGCMRIASLSKSEIQNLIGTSMELGINFFEHADIYGRGECETKFTEATEKSARNKMIIQSKCSIRPGICFDFSKDYILNSVDSILKRLDTDYLDSFLLHRPDVLVEPEEVAEAFSKLKKEGKVLHFGVSNQNPYQIELLKKFCDVEIEFNQLQLSVTECGMIDTSLNVNMKNAASVDRDNMILDYCRLNDITIQAWSPFQYGFFEGTFIDNDKFPELNAKMQELADKYSVTKSAIAIAWISRHPAKMQSVVGTTNVQRLKDIAQSSSVNLTREEWYALYLSVGKKLP